MRRNVYILEQQKIKTHKFLIKQRFKLSAGLLKICQGDLTLQGSERLEFENQWGLEQTSNVRYFHI